MKFKASVGLLVLCGLVLIPFVAVGNAPAAKSARTIAPFTLKDTAGKDVSLADFKDKKAVVVVFIGTECPVNNYYMLRLKELHKEFADKGVQFLAVNSNSQDEPARVAEHAKKHDLPFPVLKDADHQVADLFKAERTPEVFVLNDAATVIYHGRIDDQYGVGFQRPKPTRRDLAEALTQMLAGDLISKAKTDVSGCVIGRAKVSRVASAPGAQTITYSNQVSRILQKNCQECHRPGQIGPFSLMTYEKARGWADTIREIVSADRMPPWHADPKYGKFTNDRSMSKEEKATLLAWIDQGCPKGDEKDLSPPREFIGADGWSMGKPDAVFTMKEKYTVPAKAPKYGVPYQYFFIQTDFKEDMWVQAAEARPGNKSVVHHIIVFAAKPGQRRDEGGDRIGKDLLVATAPGDLPLMLPPGTARKIPKGAMLVLQMHYTPNGVEQTDQSSVGLRFAKEPPKRISHCRGVMNGRFAIPPGDGNHRVFASSKFEKDAVLESFMPHMHIRGKSFEYKAVFPDGRSEILLSVPKYDFNWQTYYHLEKPLFMPAGTRIECTGHFDNSVENPNNPDPTKTVYWGEQTWEEMLIGFLDYYYVDEKPIEGKTASAK